MKVLIINQHTHNFGDDAAGNALLRLLLSSERVSSVVVVHNGPYAPPSSDDPRVTAPREFTLRNIGAAPLILLVLARLLRLRVQPRSNSLKSLLSVIRAADVILVAPSGANIGVYRDWRFLVRLWIVVNENKTPVFHWNTIGPSGNRLFDRLARQVLRSSRLYLRERRSVEYAESLGLTCSFGYDTAFLLDSIPGSQSSDVALVPAELDSWHPTFKARPANNFQLTVVARTVAEFALEHDLSIVILPHLRSKTEADFNRNWRDALIKYGVPTHRVTLREDIETYEQYDVAIAECLMTIGGRYHAVVLAAKNNRPFVSLSYENKMAEVCRYLELEHANIDLTSPADVDKNLRPQLEHALRKGPEISRHLEQRIQSEIRPRVTLPVREAGLLVSNSHPSP